MQVMPRAEDRPVLSVEEAARILNMGKSTLYRHLADGSIPFVRIGKRVLVPTARLREFLGFSN